MRTLAVYRISRSTDESTSVERQREDVSRWAGTHHVIIGEVADEGVSGSVSPFDRPKLGQWLQPENLHKFDAIVAAKVDRLGRSTRDVLALVDYLAEHGKHLVICDLNIDTSTPGGEFVLKMISALAEFELGIIRERTRASQEHLRSMGRWHGGRVPFGYEVETRDGGKYLRHHATNAALLREAVDKRLDGMSQWQLAHWLNAQGAKTYMGRPWVQATVRNVLRSRALIGQRVSKGRLVTDETGSPVQFGEPLISFDKFEELQKYEDAQIQPRLRTGAPYLGKQILFCSGCNKTMYRRRPSPKRNYYYYYCQSHVTRAHCPDRSSVRARDAEDVITSAFMLLRGDTPVMERVFVAGSDHSQELKQVNANIARLREEANRGLIENEEYFSQLEAQDARKRELEALPQQPDRYEYRPTEQTYREAWEDADTEERRRLLLDIGVRATLYGPGSDVSREVHPVDDKVSTFRMPVGSKGHTLVLTSDALLIEDPEDMLRIFGPGAVVEPDDFRRVADVDRATEVCKYCVPDEYCDSHRRALLVILREVRKRSVALRGDLGPWERLDSLEDLEAAINAQWE